MKRKINKIVSLILAFCIIVSLVTVTGISANAATTDESIAGVRSGDFSYEVYNGYALILRYEGTSTELVIPSTIDGYTVKYIGFWDDFSYSIINKAPITSVTIPDTVTVIGTRAFENCEYLTTVNIPDSVTTIGEEAFRDCKNLTTVNIPDSVTIIGDRAFKGCNINQLVLNKNVVTWGLEAFERVKTIYVPKGIVNEFVHSFSFDSWISNVYFEGSKEEWALIERHIRDTDNWYNVYCNHPFAKPAGFAKVVSDDFILNLTQEKGNVQSGEIVLQPGIYQFNIQKGDIFNVLGGKNIFGYNKTINDSTLGSLTCKLSFKIKTILVAKGGTYNFAFNKETHALSVKRTGDIPEVYITNTSSDTNSLHLPLKPIKGTNMSVGSIYLPSAGYKFKINKNGVELGVNEFNSLVPNFDPVTVSNNMGEHLSLWVMGCMVTFAFNNDTNQISVEVMVDDRASLLESDINIAGYDFNKNYDYYNLEGSGNFSLDLDDNNGESDMATGTITLKKGVYSFKVYNRGVACGSNSIYFDKGTRTLNPNFMLPSVLYASGGKYKFTFEKSTGRLFIHRA